ncbi:SulP family inorganic anion transporter [Commensalibacter oyaizuii]|uniref:SulP family inorganic anion transporter n=1 Tax=Commensalibacter oyaizuii TaxID=3043873 RepID=A0ABT6Q187_9PROT|nr:SulP family inorganic anion transporter [Commensalibacter sp. TBRC 16381]MDI2090872.1 SulP family inorganic anion transporter [Commensalibacter sp. TBRC 16381]
MKNFLSLPAGIRSLQQLTPKNALNDVLAGIIVSSVAIPVGLAYANLMGVPAIIGLYACIIPVFIYALFGASPYLIVGPDAAVSNIVGLSLTAFSLVSTNDRVQGAAAIAIAVGIISIIAGKLRFGFIANFLSRPILTGYLAGVGIELMITQLPVVTGIDLPKGNFFQQTHFFLFHLSSIHWITFALALCFFIFIRLCVTFKPAIPAPIITVIIAIILSWAFNLPEHGVKILGYLPSGLPRFQIPSFDYPITDFIKTVLAVTIISFSSGIITARSFSAKLGQKIDANQELIGFGIANIFSGFFQGFTITGADSRTAVGISSGGKTALVGITSAISIGIIITFLSKPLGLLPSSILSIILISTAINLIDVKTFRFLLKVSVIEACFVIITVLGVLWVGVLQGIIIAIGITLLHTLLLSAKPRDAQLGITSTSHDLVNFNLEPNAKPIPHCIIYVFEASIVFFNEDFFINRCIRIINEYQNQDIRWFILDASVMTIGDASTLYALNHISTVLKQQDITFVIAGGHFNFRKIIAKSDIIHQIAGNKIYESVEIALNELIAPQLTDTSQHHHV